MKSITITYRPIPFLPLYRTVSGSFPANWGEITAPQLIAIACLYKGASTDLRFLRTMTGLPMRVLKRTDDYERFKLMEYLEFIGDRKPFHEFIVKEIKISKHVIPNLFRRHPEFISGPLYAPSPKLKGVTFAQYIFADSYFTAYQESRKEDDLNKFVAALYLPEGVTFAEKYITSNSRLIGRKDIHTRESIAINWQLIHEWLSLAYPLIFQKREEIQAESHPEGHPEFISGSGPARNSSPWIKIFENFVGDDILHNDQYANMPVNTIFQFMTRKYKENARKKN
jgi:hypothetical protein